MPLIPDNLQRALNALPYEISISQNNRELMRATVAELSGKSPIVIITDKNVYTAQSALFDTLFQGIPTFVVAPGEVSKSITTFEKVLSFISYHKLTRSSTILAIGGGVIGDLAGFVAATYMRGISYIHIPTTLLAMVDSSVGGKTAINLPAGKNLVGAFHQPSKVIIHVDFLSTLPKREFAAGMSEIIKTGLLGSEALFHELEQNVLTLGNPSLLNVIAYCCAFKAAVVLNDPHELQKDSGRILLNLGHTFGHAIEQATNYSSILHGEGVAIGLVAANNLSVLCGFSSPETTNRIIAILNLYTLPTSIPATLAASHALLNAMSLDKKADTSLRFVLLRSIGDSFVQSNIPIDTIKAAIHSISSKASL